VFLHDHYLGLKPGLHIHFYLAQAAMNKPFVKESDRDGDDDLPEAQALPAGVRNYMTPEGYERLRNELAHLMTVKRPAVVQMVSWAASNGDRSENGDYLYGKTLARNRSSHALSDQAFGHRRRG
jgi:Transcription elongation factor, N-terminal